MSISQLYHYLLSLVALISRWIQNFRRTAGLTSSAFHDWSIEQSVSVPTFLGQLQTGCKWLRTKYTRIHLSTEWDCFFPENWTDFLFQELPEEIQSKIVYIYSVINEYSLRSRDVHSTPSWHKWSDFEYRPWCLAIVVRKPPGPKMCRPSANTENSAAREKTASGTQGTLRASRRS